MPHILLCFLTQVIIMCSSQLSCIHHIHPTGEAGPAAGPDQAHQQQPGFSGQDGHATGGHTTEGVYMTNLSMH